MRVVDKSRTAAPASRLSATEGDSVQLRALPLLWRGTTEIQIGTDPRWAVALTDLSPAAARALVGLRAGTTLRSLIAALQAEAVPEDEVDTVLAHLRAAHLVVPPSADDPTASTRADARTLALLAPDGDAAPVLARRARSVVLLRGLGRTGSGIATALACAGVGTLLLEDPTRTRAEEVGFGGLGAAAVGTARATALARVLLDVRPTLRTVAPAGRSPDIVVLVEQDVADPIGYAPLLDSGQAHLSVVIGEAAIRVGPRVLPGRTACLRCLELHHTDVDPAWPTVAAQLAAGGSRVARDEETSLAVMAAATATVQVLAALDGRPVTVDGAALEIALPLGLPVSRRWDPHPRCGCGSQLPDGTPQGTVD
ncbi:thiamine biosynthesis protein ThiF [Actinotalea sp.]|uniref:thiamine biosynthesis protein ThiF n=1 Tax=Actinotalea sp. TaxID=1872145 RepID=UPI003563DB3A